MAGTSLASGLVAVVSALSVGLALAGGAAVTSQRLAAAADAAALAAADVAIGAVPTADSACVAARRVAEAQGARLTACEFNGFVATVEVSIVYAGLVASARARAGPQGRY